MSALQINKQEGQCLRSKMKTDHKRQGVFFLQQIIRVDNWMQRSEVYTVCVWRSCSNTLHLHLR